MLELPLYKQLRDKLISDIRTEFDTGELLPSERNLAQETGMSRTTVRLALDELESLGYISREHGRGSIVNDISLLNFNLAGMYSFTEESKALGKVPTSKVVSINTEKPDHDIQEKLRLKQDELVIVMERIRLADGVPMIAETTYLPYDTFPGLENINFEENSLYDVMFSKYHVAIKDAFDEFNATIISKEQSQLLGVDPGSAVLQVRRTTHSTENEIIEYTDSIVRSDKFSYRTVHRVRS